jgi:peptidylprolyl isomerase
VAAAVVLTGCGGNSSSGSNADNSGAGVDSLTVNGHVGTSSNLTFNGKITDSAQVTKVLVTGHGPKVTAKDAVVLQTVIADGTTKKTLSDSYQGSGPSMVDLAGHIQPFLVNALAGKNVGSRVLLAVSASKIFGPSGNAQVGIGGTDTLVFVLDLVGLGKTGPDGKSQPAPAWAPKIQRTKGVVSGLDFAKAPKPDGKLHVAAVKTGTGAKVKKGQTIFVQYLGAVYRGKQPFDQNFSGSSPGPTAFQIGTGKVIKGWDRTLVGQRVGSEVLLQIPPKDGYGKKAQQGIPANSTLYFVVDILGAV